MRAQMRTQMRTRSILVLFPGIPFDMNSLLPSERVACLAAALLDAGHETRILDYGTVSVFDRLHPKSVREAAQTAVGYVFGMPAAGSLATLSTLVRLRKVERMRTRRAGHLYGETAAELVREATSSQSDFIAFYLEDPRAIESVLAIARQVRAFLPRLRFAFAGPCVQSHGSRLAASCEPFDVLCAWNPESVLARWADHLDRPEMWPLIPNLIVPGAAAKARLVGRELFPIYQESGPTSRYELPPACYDAEIYPAAANGSKFRLLTFQSSRNNPAWEGEAAYDADSCGAIERKPPHLLADEMMSCIDKWGCSAFHFIEAAPAASHAAAVAHEILGRGIPCVYSSDGPSSGLNPALFALLQASGCRAMRFSIDSGSQRLLDDFYRRAISVSETEHMLRACRHAGIFTVARFVYPSPADDYHTRAETVRLIMRARPNSVLVQPFEASTNVGAKENPLYERTFLRGRAFGGGRDRVRLGVADRDGLLREIEHLGLSTSVTPQLALVANSVGYAGHEQDFATILSKSFFTGDAAGIASAIKQFNAHMVRQAHGASAGHLTPLLAAVGN